MDNKRNEQELIRIEKLKKLKELGFDPYGEKFNSKDSTFKIKENYDKLTKEELEEKNIEFSIAGRIRTIRSAGKAIFANLQDKNDSIQIYIKKDILTEKESKAVDLLDIGDIIGITGKIFKTKVGELSLYVSSYTPLVKSIKVLPEKFHGLTDKEERERKRYLDLIVNKDSKNIFFTRSKIINEIRNILISNDFQEFETPILTSLASGAHAKPFLTHHNTLDMELSLRIALELPLKRLLVGGLERVFEIGRVFRNEGISTRHNPEFTMVEIYQSYSDMETMMDLTENIFKNVSNKVLGKTKITYQGVEINLGNPFNRIHMVDAIKDELGIDFWDKNITLEDAKKIAKEKNIKVEKHEQTIGHIINLLFEEFIEEKIVQPTFVYGHPVEISPLAKKNKKDERFTDRFELFINKREYANAYSELNDPFVQKQRFLDQLEEKKLGNDEANDYDHDFIEALEYGMPPAGGLGIGIDRFVMLLTNSSSIRDVILFPHKKEKE